MPPVVELLYVAFILLPANTLASH